jgi:hypothetical protein
MGTTGYQFFAEDLDVKPQMMDSLPLEFFNHELQKVDTTSVASMRSFCERYGLIFSPLYESKTHALEGRETRGKVEYLDNYPTVYKDGVSAVERLLATKVRAFGNGNGFLGSEYPAIFLKGSEFAREAVARGEFADRNFGAVVSVDEVAYTIRLLQVATALLSAFAAGLKGNELLGYLLDTNHLQGKVPAALKDHESDLLLYDHTFGTLLPATKERACTAAQEAPGGAIEDADVIADIYQKMEQFLNLHIERAADNAQSFTMQARSELNLENHGVGIGSSDDNGDTKSYADLLFKPTVALSEGSLIEAILSNFEFVMASKIDWITCEHCGRVFKYQKEYDPSNRYRQATFCKNSCRVMTAQGFQSSQEV